MVSRKPDPDGPPIGPQTICLECGGTGLYNGEVDAPTSLKLPAEQREMWVRQMMNRPEIHTAMDFFLSWRFEERLNEIDTPREFMAWCHSFIGEISADMDVASKMPAAEQGRVIREALLNLLVLGSEISWFLAHQGYPKRSSVARYIKQMERENEGHDAPDIFTDTDTD